MKTTENIDSAIKYFEQELIEIKKDLSFDTEICDHCLLHVNLAIEALKIQQPREITIQIWNATYCPNCEYELSEHQGDGYYYYPEHLKMCPNCGQKIFWTDKE